MKMSALNDIISWDIVNWSKALEFWEKNAAIKNKQYRCLEVGAHKGGLSLWLALNKNNVLCTDLNGPEKSAPEIHKRYNCDDRIEYGALDATNIPFQNHFDVIAFKSILGRIPGDPVNEMHKALKPGGMLLFAENLEATSMHKVLRKRYGAKGWKYLKVQEVDSVFGSFSKVTYTTVGFIGCFGRNRTQRNILGRVDRVLEKFIPPKYRYIIVGIAVK